jgi:magnesium transporter
VVKVTCVALEQHGVMRLEDAAKAVASWHAGRGPYWFHLGGARAEGVATWLSSLGLDAETIELLHLEQEETRILPLADAVLFSYPVCIDVDTPPTQFQFLCLDRMLVTIDRDLERSPLLGDSLVARMRIREGTTAALVCALTLVHSGRVRRQVVALRAQADALASRMDADPWAVPLREVLDFKRRVLVQGGVVDEELAIVEFLRASKLPVLPLQPLAEALEVGFRVLRSTERDVDRLDRRALDLHRRHESAEQDRMNRRLGVLTVISAVFMPLTLIAGIYGMNFEVMPELHFRLGYPITLAAMATLGAVLFWYFRTRWWGK